MPICSKSRKFATSSTELQGEEVSSFSVPLCILFICLENLKKKSTKRTLLLPINTQKSMPTIGQQDLIQEHMRTAKKWQGWHFHDADPKVSHKSCNICLIIEENQKATPASHEGP